MPGETFSWLHLTDLHFGLKGQRSLWPNLRQPFLDDLGPLRERCGPWDAVLFTGDLSQSGTSEQFRDLQAEVLDRLWARLEELGSGDAALLAVPGNHDLFWPTRDDDDAAVDTLLDGDFGRIAERFWEKPTSPYRRVVKQAFAAYEAWWSKAPHRPQVTPGMLPGDFAASLKVGSRQVGILGLNTAFLQLGRGNFQGRLVWDSRQVHALCPDGVDTWTEAHDLCLLMTHHGPEWLSPEARVHGESEIAPPGRFAAHLYGHQHETEFAYSRRGGSIRTSRLLQGPSVFGMEHIGDAKELHRVHGYVAGQVVFGEEPALRLWPRLATSRIGGWRFIPDHEHAELKPDEGTSPEPLLLRRRPARPAAPSRPAVAPEPTGPRSTLPGRRPFFGRADALARIAGWLRPEDRSWGVVLDGPGGVGKSALALEAAHRAPAEHYPLKLWITAKTRDLHPEGERRRVDQKVDDFYGLCNELALALGRDDIPRAPPDERPALLRRALAGHRVLLVLDNLETLNSAARGRVLELLNELPAGCRALLTNRRRDGAAAGHVLRVDRLEREAADELLHELGQRSASVAALSERDRDRLYEETGGNPLLLTWTVGQLGRVKGRAKTVDEALARLVEAHRHEGAGNDPLAYVFGDLVESFTAAELEVLAALAHFTEPAPVRWLLPMTKLSPKAAETALDGLRDRALLVEDATAGTWLLPPLAGRYLKRCRPKEVEQSGERLARDVYALVMENGFREHERFPALEEAWPRISAALPVFLAGENIRLQVVSEALNLFLNFSGRWDLLIGLFTEAEAKALVAGDLRSAGWRAQRAGFCHCLLGQPQAVQDCADRAAKHWRDAGDPVRERAVTIRLRGLAHFLAKDLPAAHAAHEEALALLRALSPMSTDVAAALNDLAAAQRAMGRFDEAEATYREALALVQGHANAEVVATCTGNLAELALDRARWSEAERLAREALALSENLGRQELIASDSTHLAHALAQQGRPLEGLAHAERAVQIYTRLRSPDLAEAQAALALCRR